MHEVKTTPSRNALIERVAHIHTKAESVVAAVAYFITASILIIDVVARNLFQVSWLGSTSVAVLASVIAGFLGLSLATANRSHLRIEALDGVLPQKLRPMAERLGQFFSMLIFMILAWFAFLFVRESASWGDLATDLSWPIWLFQIVMPLAFISTAIRHLYLIIYPELGMHHEQTNGASED